MIPDCFPFRHILTRFELTPVRGTDMYGLLMLMLIRVLAWDLKFSSHGLDSSTTVAAGMHVRYRTANGKDHLSLCMDAESQSLRKHALLMLWTLSLTEVYCCELRLLSPLCWTLLLTFEERAVTSLPLK